MTDETPIEIDKALIDELRAEFRMGKIIDDAGRRHLVEEEVGRFDGLVVQIYGREHPPPQFCVRHQGASASFSIETGVRLPKNKGLEDYERNIRKWWSKNRLMLIERWNATRPTDCPVGAIRTTMK